MPMVEELDNMGDGVNVGSSEIMGRGSHERDLVAFMNRLVMIENHAIALKEALIRLEPGEDARTRLRALIQEDEEAVEALETAIRGLDGQVSQLRKTGGRLVGMARSVVETLPDRARAVIERRDLNAARETPPLARFLDHADLYVGESAAYAHWRILRAISESADVPPVREAVEKCEDVAREHVEFFATRAESVAREAFRPAEAPVL